MIAWRSMAEVKAALASQGVDRKLQHDPEEDWVTKGPEFKTVYDDPKPRAESPSPST